MKSGNKQIITTALNANFQSVSRVTAGAEGLSEYICGDCFRARFDDAFEIGLPKKTISGLCDNCSVWHSRLYPFGNRGARSH